MPGSAEGVNHSGTAEPSLSHHRRLPCDNQAIRKLGEHALLAMWFSAAAVLVHHKAGSGNVPSNAGKKPTSLFTDKTAEEPSGSKQGTMWRAAAGAGRVECEETCKTTGSPAQIGPGR